MIKSRAKPHRVQKLIERLDAADTAICNAALTNVLTKRGDEWLRDVLHVVRRFRKDVEREAKDKGLDE